MVSANEIAGWITAVTLEYRMLVHRKSEGLKFTIEFANKYVTTLIILLWRNEMLNIGRDCLVFPKYCL